MAKKKEIILPKVFEDRNGKYPQHKGKPKASYSQLTSYDDPQYQGDYYLQYFMGIDLGGNDFSLFGNKTGDYISHFAEGKSVDEFMDVLSEDDVKFIHEMVNFPENCVYEDEICADFVDFVLEGYIDRAHYEGSKVHIRDYKTLNLDKKAEYYASPEYRQTTLYCWTKEQEGYEIGVSDVLGLGRKGTTINGDGNWRMRLSGDSKIIPTPYSKERAEEMKAWVRGVVERISEDYKTYKRLFVD